MDAKQGGLPSDPFIMVFSCGGGIGNRKIFPNRKPIKNASCLQKPKAQRIFHLGIPVVGHILRPAFVPGEVDGDDA